MRRLRAWKKKGLALLSNHLIFDRRIPHEKEPVVRYHNGVTNE